MPLHQIQTRSGPEVAAKSRKLMAQIDNFDALLQPAGPVIPSPDSDTWLVALRNSPAHPRLHDHSGFQPQGVIPATPASSPTAQRRAFPHARRSA